MLNKGSSLRHLAQLKKAALPASLLLCIGWWVSGWFLKSVPAWWTLAFTSTLLVSLWLMWRELRQWSARQKEQAFLNSHTAEEMTQVTDRALAPSGTSSASARSVQVAVPVALGAQVRNYASVEDAVHHGWTFEEKIGSFDGADLFSTALHPTEGSWLFDGLLPAKSFVLDVNAIAVGQIKYKRPETPAEE